EKVVPEGRARPWRSPLAPCRPSGCRLFLNIPGRPRRDRALQRRSRLSLCKNCAMVDGRAEVVRQAADLLTYVRMPPGRVRPAPPVVAGVCKADRQEKSRTCGLSRRQTRLTFCFDMNYRLEDHRRHAGVAL